ncbi:MAG: Nif3-like dinuclear metal center hexameric protein, partial [Planctomycetaceae bacterium]
EAVSRQVDLVVAHHPILFRPVQRLTSDMPEGTMLLSLIAAGVADYSPHTAFDSAADGINQSLAESLGLIEIDVLRPVVPKNRDGLAAAPRDDGSPSPLCGGGRMGRLPKAEPLIAFNERVKRALNVRHLQYVGDDRQPIGQVAVACGSAAEFLPDARRQGCDVLVTGEARFHACLEARLSGTAMILAGHYATERPAVELLARRIAERFPGLDCGTSQVEQDPVRWSAP